MKSCSLTANCQWLTTDRVWQTPFGCNRTGEQLPSPFYARAPANDGRYRRDSISGKDFLVEASVGTPFRQHKAESCIRILESESRSTFAHPKQARAQAPETG